MHTPLAEPVPEPEPVVRSISIPGYRIYRIPLAEPEQQQVKRVSRRIVGTQRLPVSVTDDTAVKRPSTTFTPATAATSSTATSPSTGSSSSTEIPIDVDTNTPENRLFDKTFIDVSEQPSWSIDTARFNIIPAVPSDEAVRVPNEVSEEQKFKSVEKETITAEFSPVPAVPVTTAASLVSSTSEVLPVSCQGDCVQQFCSHSDRICQDKCKTICTL